MTINTGGSRTPRGNSKHPSPKFEESKKKRASVYVMSGNVKTKRTPIPGNDYSA